MTGRIRKIWSLPFAVLSVAAFGAGALLHRQALHAAASDSAPQELGSCCHPAERATTPAPGANGKETRSRLALGAGLLFLAAAIAPAALAREEAPLGAR